MPFGAAEEQIIDAAKNYSTILHKASELVTQAPDDLLSGTPATMIYLKKLGHRALTTEDVQSLISALGNVVDKQIVLDSQQAQLELSQRLQKSTIYEGAKKSRKGDDNIWRYHPLFFTYVFSILSLTDLR